MVIHQIVYFTASEIIVFERLQYYCITPLTGSTVVLNVNLSGHFLQDKIWIVLTCPDNIKYIIIQSLFNAHYSRYQP